MRGYESACDVTNRIKVVEPEVNIGLQSLQISVSDSNEKKEKVRTCPKSGPVLARPAGLAALPLLLGDSPTTMLEVDRRMVLNNDGRTTKISV